MSIKPPPLGFDAAATRNNKANCRWVNFVRPDDSMLSSSFPVSTCPHHRIKRGENQRECPALSKQGIDGCGDPSTRYVPGHAGACDGGACGGDGTAYSSSNYWYRAPGARPMKTSSSVNSSRFLGFWQFPIPQFLEIPGATPEEFRLITFGSPQTYGIEVLTLTQGLTVFLPSFFFFPYKFSGRNPS